MPPLASVGESVTSCALGARRIDARHREDLGDVLAERGQVERHHDLAADRLERAVIGERDDRLAVAAHAQLAVRVGVVRQRLLERLDRLARLLQRDVGDEQVLRGLDRDQVAERVVEAAALADRRADEAGLHPVAQARLLDGEDAGDIANGIQLDHGVLLCASTLRDRCSSEPRARLSTSTWAVVSSQPADFLASATAMRRACSRHRSSDA